MATLEILVGMIASGKSTYASNAAKRGSIIINDDAIVTMLHGGDYTLYNTNLKGLYKSVETSIATVALAMGLNVVVDRGVNIRKKGRHRWLWIADQFNAKCIAVLFPNLGPDFHAKLRYDSDNRGKSLEWWRKVALEHNNDYEFPTIQEGFSKVVKESVPICSKCNNSFCECSQGR